MSPRVLQDLIKNLQVFYRCPSCSAEYSHDDIRFLGKVDKHCFMQMNCSKCSLPVLATVLISVHQPDVKAGKRKAPSVRQKFGHDATRRERATFNQLGAISSHEIADFYTFLRSL